LYGDKELIRTLERLLAAQKTLGRSLAMLFPDRKRGNFSKKLVDFLALCSIIREIFISDSLCKGILQDMGLIVVAAAGYLCICF